MTSPLVRTWLAARLLEARDICCDAWYTFRPNVNAFWDEVPWKYRHREPAADTAVPDVPMLRPCRRILGGCGARPGIPCLTRDGKPTRMHRARSIRQPAEVLEGQQ